MKEAWTLEERVSALEAKSDAVSSNSWLAAELDRLINETIMLKKNTPIGTPEWDTLDGRRSGLQTARNLIGV